MSHRIEQMHHRVTRIALGTPYRRDAFGYKSFPQRVRELHRNTLAERRIISSITYVHKLLNDKIDSPLVAYLLSFLVQHVRYTRRPNIVDVSGRRIAMNSPLRAAMMNVNTYRNQITFTKSEKNNQSKVEKRAFASSSPG